LAPRRARQPLPTHNPLQLGARRLSDVEEFRNLFGRWNGEFRQLSRGKFDGVIHVAAGGLLRAFHAETNQAVLTRGSDSASFVTFIPITPRNEATVWQGRRLSTGQLIVKSPEVEYDNLTGRDTVIHSLLVPEQALRQAARVLTGREVGADINSWVAIRPSPERMRQFERGLATLLAASVGSTGALATPHSPTLEIECLRRLIDVLVDRATGAAMPRCAGSRSMLVKRAVSFMHDRLDRPLSALELCAELGVSDRMLRRAFQEAFGLGPLAYFRVMRLHAVRAALKSARGGDESVVRLARHWGFNRLGSFAAEYQRQFGELPSETLGVRGWPGVQQMTQLRI